MKNDMKKLKKGELEKIYKKISRKNQGLINKFLKSKDGYITENRKNCIRQCLIKFAGLVGKDLSKLTKDEVTRAWGVILKANLSDRTKADYATDIKQAFRYWFGEDEFYPKTVSKIKRPPIKAGFSFKKILTEEQIYQMIKACINSRDKFFISLVGLDGALRPCEALRLKWIDVKRDKHGHYVVIKTAKKSGDSETRVVRIIKSEPYFIKWNSEYPKEKKEEDFVFINYSNHQSVNKNNIDALFRRLKHKLKFEKLNPYLLRHSLITKMSKDARISQPVLKKFIGHSQRSNSIAWYQHFGDEDTKDMQLEYNGIIKKKEKEIKEMNPIICPKCQTSNEYDAEICQFCSNALTQKRMVEYEDLKQELEHWKKKITQINQKNKSYNSIKSTPDLKKQIDLIIDIKLKDALKKQEKEWEEIKKRDEEEFVEKARGTFEMLEEDQRKEMILVNAK